MTRVALGVGIPFRVAGAVGGGGAGSAPILAPDTWYFGQLSAVGAAPKKPVNLGGTITSYSLTDPSGKFTINTTTGFVSVAPGQTLGAATYPLTITATGPGGPDSETYNAVCTGTDPEGYSLDTAFSVASQAEFDAALTVIGTAATGARTIMFRGGSDYDYTATRLLMSNKAFANRVTVTTHAGENRAWIRGGTVAGSRSAVKLTDTAVNKFTIDRLKLSTEAFSSGTDSGVVEVDQFVSVDGFEVKRCEIFYNGLPPLSALATATGVRPEGITFHGTATITGGVLIEDCDIHDLEYGIRQVRGDGTVLIRGCDIHGFIQDAIQLNLTAGQTNTHIHDVDIWDCYASTAAGIHGDMIQLLNGLSQDWPGLQVYRCRLIQNIPGSDAQAMYLVGANGGFQVKGHVRGCLIVQDGFPTNALYSNRAEDYTVEDVTVVTPSWATTGQGSIVIGNTEAVGTNTVRNSISMRAPSGTGLVTSNNVTLGDLPNAATKATYFAGDGTGDWSINSIAEAMTKLAAKTDGALYTSSPRIGAIGTGVVTFSSTRPGHDGFFTERPANSVLPAITGTPEEGQTLSASTGTWTGTPTSYTYQWKMDGSNLTGETASTLLLANSMVGGLITVQVTATNSAGSTAATSASAGPVTGLASYDSDAQTLFTFWEVTNSTPENTTHKNLADDLIVALKAAGVWSKLDFLYVFAVGNRVNARTNWKNPGTYTAIEVGSPSWTADRSFTASNSTSNYLKTGFRPWDGGTYNMKLNDNHLAVYVRASASDNNMAEAGSGRLRLSARQFGQNWNVQQHVNSTLAPGGPASTVGHACTTRTSSTNVDLYHTTTSGVTTKYGGNAHTTNQTVIDSELVILGCNNGTHPTISMSHTSNRSVAAAHGGSQLTQVEVEAIAAALDTYLTAVGAI